MTTALTLHQNAMPTPAGNLESYVSTIHNIPVLSVEEERELAEKLRDNNDLESAKLLILHNLRFVVKVARGYNGYGLPLNDLIQEGNIGLMKAVKRFDPSMNVRLISFAVHWIRAEIHEFILRNWKIVKVATTKAQRKLFFNLRSSKKRLGWLSHDQAKEIADDLGVSHKDVVEMEKRLVANDVAYDAPKDHGEEEAVYSPSHYLAAVDADPAEQLEAQEWEAHTRSQFAAAIAELDERSQDIIASRWLSEPKATLQDLAGKYGVSAERVRQLENAAIKKMQLAVAQ